MSASVFDKLEEIYPQIIGLIPDDQFNTHEFMLTLVQEYQELYVQALIEHSENEHPSLIVVKQIAQRLKERDDLVIYIGSEAIENVFEQNHEFEVWKKARK